MGLPGEHTQPCRARPALVRKRQSNRLWAEIIAVNDATNTLEDTSVTVRVLANDYDPQGGTLAIVGTSTTNGTAIVNGTNVVFTPATNFFGTVVFSYTVSDGTNQATANVTVTVAPVNDAPVAVNDAYSLTQGSSLTVAAPGVLTNDTDVEGDALIRRAGCDAGAWHADIGSRRWFHLYAYEQLSQALDSFTYSASDASATSTVATVSLNIIALPTPAMAPDVFWHHEHDRTQRQRRRRDGDGLKNIFECAFNTNPTNANVSPMTLQHRERPFACDVPAHPPRRRISLTSYEVATNLMLGDLEYRPGLGLRKSDRQSERHQKR